MGEETDGVAESTSKLQEKLKALTGVDIVDMNGAYKDTYTILKEIGSVWKDLDPMDQAAALELMAGKNRANTLAAILNNMTDLEGAYNDALKAEGSALKENQAYLDSIQGRIDLFNNSVQSMWMNFIDSEVIKFIVDLGTGLIKLIDNVGVLTSAFTVLGGIFVNKKWGNLFFGDIESATKNIKQLQDAVDAAKQKWEYSKSSKDYEVYQKELENLEAYKVEFGLDKATDSVKKFGDTGEEVCEQLSFDLDNVGNVGEETFEQLSFDLGGVEDATKDVGDAAEVSGTKMSGSFNKAKVAVSELWVQIKQLAKSMLTMYAVSAVFDVLSDGISWVTEKIKDSSNSAEALKDKYEEASDKLSQCESELRSLESELKTVDEQIEELIAQGTPTYAEQEELERLQSISAELERQISLQQTLQGSLQTGANANAVNAGNAYLNTSFDSEKSKTDRQDEAEESGKTIGKAAGLAAGTAIGTAIALGAAGFFTGGATWAAIPAALSAGIGTIGVSAGIGALSGNLLGGAIGAASEGVEYDQEQTVEEAINTMNESRDKLIKARDEAYEAYVSSPTDTEKMEEYESAAQALSLYDGKMADHITQMSQYYNTITSNWDKATDDQKETAKHYGDLIDKYNIAMGGKGSEVAALDRVFGENASDEIQTIKEQILDAVRTGKDFDFATAINGSQELKDTLDYIGLSAEDVKNYFTQIGEAAKNAAFNDVNPVDTYSALVTEVESYNEVLTQTQEIVADNTGVTQEYKDALKALGISEEELSECFDENNGLIVKNAALLNKLVKQKKQDQKATVQEAKAMSQLQYKNTVQQLQQVVKAMAVEVYASGFVSSAALNTAASLREQLAALKETIQQYALLEISLSDAANAYSEFEAAKERDAQLTYGDSMVEMLQTINEGFKTGQVGTEAFEYAVKVIVPESEYAHIDNIEQRMIAIHDYIDKNPLFADWFTIDEGEFSITLDNINSFIDDAFGAGLFTNDSSGSFFLTEAIKNAEDPLKEFADQLGKAFNTEVTEGSVLAMLSELEKYDASWGNILTDLTTTPIDRAINDATTALEEAITAQEEFIRSGGNLNSDEYIKLEEAVAAARGELDKASQAAIDNAQTYTQVEAVLKGMTGEVKYTQEQADALARSLGLINENGHIQIDTETGALILTQEQVDALNERLTGLTKPTILDVQLAYDEIDRQLQELNAYLSDPSNYDGTILTELSITNEGEAKAKVDELTADRDAIQLVYNITTTSSAQETGTLEKLTTWEANGVQITISGDASAFDATIGEVNAVEMEEKDVIIKADPTEANANIDSVDKNNIDDKEPGIYMQGVSVALNNIYSVDDALNALPSTKNIYVNVHYTQSGAVGVNGTVNVDGTAHVNGTAYSNGNWGAPRTEVALTGELGPEMVVRNGRWFTVGENGAEFTQIKKGDIIFNHKQTEDLLSKGYVTGRGKAYANGTIPHTTSGTAYYQTFGGYVGDNDVFENGSNNWMDPWTNSFSSAADSMSDAADSISDAADDAEQVVDFVEMKLEEIEAIITKTTTKIANFLDDTTSIKSKDELYDELVKAEKYKSETYLKAAQKYNVEAAAALSGVPQKYQEMARNGAIAIKDFIGEDQVEIAEKIQEYRDWAAKADEAENGHLEAIAAISAHRVEQLEDIATDFENIISISKSHSDLLQAEMDFIEESGNRLSESYYEELKKHSQKQLDDMQNERAALQKILDDSVAAGDVVIGSDDWYSMLETIYEVDQEIIDCKTSLEEFQNAINELYWDNFDKFITEIDNVNSELSNLYDLISDDDKITDDMGNWTDEGITALGLLAQQMENAQFKSQQYGEAIAKLKKDYADGLYSTDEYNERLSDLTESQYDAIKSYEDAKDAIVDLNKTRVEAVKDGLQKEIDAYSELIEKKKESLNSDKDAYEVQKQIQEYNENIKDIERKIASLEGNTTSSAMAQRKRLEAELLKAREELQDYYYNHSIEKQQEALDKELEGYTQNKQDQMDALDEYLEKEEQVIADSFDLIAENTKSVVDTLIGISEEYGVTISDTVATPWIEGANAIGTYQEQLDTSVSATTANLETLKQHLEDLQTQADKTAESVVAATHSTIVETNDSHQTSIKGYAKGSKSVEYDQWALIDELGDELQLVPNETGRLDYIKKGTGILNNTLTEKLMDLAMDPTSVLENSRPVIGAPGITTTNNTITINESVGTLLHVEHLDGSNPAEVAKLVDKAWEKKMQTLNNSIKKFTR